MRWVAVALVAVLGIQEDAKPVKQRRGGFLGITFRELDDKERKELGIGTGGLRIEAVQAGSCAEAEGFKAGDAIADYSGKAIPNGDEFIKMLWMGRGETPVLGIRREGKSVEIKAGLKQLDAKPAVGDRAPEFALKTPDGKREVKLADLVGKKPVFLIFASWT